MNLDLDRSNWERVRFGDVVRNLNETVKDAAAAGIDRVIALEHLDPGELKVSRWGDPADGTTFTKRVRPGQTLFGKRRAYQRKAACPDFEAITSGDILVFEASRSRLLSELLPFLVQSEPFFAHALDTSAGSLSPRTNWGDLAKFEFHLPALGEQQRIADVLWAAENHANALAAASGLLTAVSDVFLDNAFVEGNESVEGHANFLVGYAFKSAQFGNDEPENHDSPRLLRGINVGLGATRWDRGDTVRWTGEIDASSQYWLKPGDFVIPMDRPFTAAGKLRFAELGNADVPALLVQRVARLRPHSPAAAGVVRALLQSPSFQSNLGGALSGSFAPHLAHGDFRRFKFAVVNTSALFAVSAELGNSVIATKQEALAVTQIKNSILNGVFA